LIRDLKFAPGARATMDQRLERLPWFKSASGPNAERMRNHLSAPLLSVPDYLEQGLRLVVEILGLDVLIRRSSELRIDSALHGQDRIIALCRAAGATSYLNSPGGRDLYDTLAFNACGIELDFLPEYAGPHFHLLPALMSLSGNDLRQDVVGQAVNRIA
jgi:hypothetical protein